MTRPDPSTLESRELDARVAELVFGIDPWAPKRCMHTGAEHHEEKVVRADVPHYSTTWDGFGLVVERMIDMGWEFRKLAGCVRFRNARQQGEPILVDWLDDFRRAACIAAIRAIEGTEQ